MKKNIAMEDLLFGWLVRAHLHETQSELKPV